MSSHARLSASSAERFMNCAGSVALGEILVALGIVEDESEYAAGGTAAHALGERCLREGLDTYMFMGEVVYTDESGKDWTVDDDMCIAVQEYVDYVRLMIGDAEMIIEQRIENLNLSPDFGGTADVVGHRIKDGGGFIHVMDYKHGAGLAVDIEDNKQLMYYAFGVLLQLGIEMGADINVGLTIIQPRAFHRDGTIREVWVSSDTILEWGHNELLPAMAAVDTEAGRAQFNDGPHCRYCPAKLVCPIMTALWEDWADENNEWTEDHLKEVSDEYLAECYRQVKTLEFRIKAVKAECYRRAMAGNAVGGTKLVYGRSTRVFKDKREIEGGEITFADAVVLQFGDDAYTDPELKSPAQIEKLPGGKAFAGEWVYKERGKPTLVAEDADGEPYVPNSGEGFKGVGQ